MILPAEIIEIIAMVSPQVWNSARLVFRSLRGTRATRRAMIKFGYLPAGKRCVLHWKKNYPIKDIAGWDPIPHGVLKELLAIARGSPLRDYGKPYNNMSLLSAVGHNVINGLQDLAWRLYYSRYDGCDYYEGTDYCYGGPAGEEIAITQKNSKVIFAVKYISGESFSAKVKLAPTARPMEIVWPSALGELTGFSVHRRDFEQKLWEW